MDNGTVVAAALPDRRLGHKTALLSQIQGIALVSGSADDGFVHEAQHGSFFEGRLDCVRLSKRIVRRTALEADGDLGLYVVYGHLHAAFAYLLLGGKNTHHVHVQLFIP